MEVPFLTLKLTATWNFTFLTVGTERLEKVGKCPALASLYLFKEFNAQRTTFDPSRGGLESIWIRTGMTPCTGIGDARQVMTQPYPMPAWFQALMARPEFFQYPAGH